MTVAVPVRCPQCGANLKVNPSDENVTCSYCGTTSMLARRGQTRSSHPGNIPVIVISKGPSAALVASLVSVALVAVVAALFMVRGGGPTSEAPPPTPPVPPPPPRVAPAPVPKEPTRPPEPTLRLMTGRKPLLADLDGDGAPDVISLASLGPQSVYAGLSSASGKLLWKIDAGEHPRDRFAAVAAQRLFIAGEAGQVAAYDLGTAAPQWTTGLGDRVLGFCGAKDGVTVLVADGRAVTLDAKTGRQTPAQVKSCPPVATDHEPDRVDPRDRTDRRAPDGVLALRCGGVTVMGSESYTVPDACAARFHVDTDNALGGMVGHALWQLPGGRLLAIGVRHPGTHAPMLAVLAATRRHKVAWKVDVMPDNPLDAEERAPEPVLLDDDRVIAGYALKAGHETHLAAFALTDGQRLWDVPISGARVDAATLAAGRVYLYRDGRVELRDPADGSVVRVFP